jgi:hypothetical protein
MAGNGFYDRFNQVYTAKSVETWDDYDGSSAGTDWDSFADWAGTPSFPLTYTTSIYDNGDIDLVNTLLSVSTPGRFNTTITYGNTVDSSGGTIDSASTVSYNYGGDTVNSIEARYLQFTLTWESDSAGDDNIAEFSSIGVTLDAKNQINYVNNLSLNTLPGSVGSRTYTPIVNAQGAVVQVRDVSTDPYVATDYVQLGDSAGGDYVEPPTLQLPQVFTTVSPSAIVFDVYDQNQNRVDCKIDMIVSGRPGMVTDANGNIIQA